MNDMKHLPAITNRDQLTTNGASSMPSWQRPSAEKMEDTKPIIRQILSSYPDYGKAPARYLLAITEFVADLTPAEQMLLVDPRNGIASRCTFLPTIADMTALLNERRAARDQYRPAHTAHRYFRADPDPPPLSPESKARAQKLVDEMHARWSGSSVSRFDYGKAENLKSSSDLKTPDGPISEYLRQKLIDEHYEHLAPMATP